MRNRCLLTDHGQKELMDKTYGIQGSNYILSSFKDTVNRLSLKHQTHKLLVAQAEKSSLILLFFFIPHT